MAKIVKAYKQSNGAARFIGKKYGDSDRVNGSFAAKWDEWFQKGWFSAIEQQADDSYDGDFDERSAYIGLMRGAHSGEFEYWIGIFAREGAAVPEGYESIDFPAGNLGVCWIYGKEAEVFMREAECWERLEKEGYSILAGWCFERYVQTRFSAPDEEGNIILDICFLVR